MSDKTCLVPGCASPARARSLCNLHYKRMRKFGDVLADVPAQVNTPADTPALDRLLASSERSASGCLLWTGYLNRDGYGELKVRGHYHMAHRLAYELEHGEQPHGSHIDHACGVRRCIEITHLRSVTAAENVQYRTHLDPRNNSGFRGVFQVKGGKWQAGAMKDGVPYYLGVYDTPEEAGAVASEWRAKNYKLGEFYAIA